MSDNNSAPDSWETQADQDVTLATSMSKLNVNAPVFIPNVNAPEFVPSYLKESQAQPVAPGRPLFLFMYLVFSLFSLIIFFYVI